MEISKIEVSQTPRGRSERSRRHVTQIHDLVRRGAANLGLEILELDRPEIKNSAAHRGNPVEHLNTLEEVIPGLIVPKTQSYDDWTREGGLPVVAKDTKEARGKGKYLIETPDQADRFRAWFEANAEGRQERVRATWAFQSFVENLGDRLTAFRVIADCTGHTLAGQLMYSHAKDGRTVVIQDRTPLFNAPRPYWWGEEDRSIAYEKDVRLARELTPNADLEIPEGEFFLAARAIAANRMFRRHTAAEMHARRELFDPKGGYVDPKGGSTARQGNSKKDDTVLIGGSIVLSGTPLSHPISDEEGRILEVHGLDPKHPRIPEKMERDSQAIARHLGVVDGTIKGLWFASDWVQDAEGKPQLMEVNYRPDMGAMSDHLGGMDLVNDFQAQLHALRSTFDNLAAVLRKQ